MNDDTLGTIRTSVVYNEHNAEAIQEMRNACANLIDLIEKYKERDPRLCALAQTEFENGCMWAIKCIAKG